MTIVKRRENSGLPRSIARQTIMDCQKLVENASEIAGQTGGQSSKSSYQSPSIRRDMKKFKKFCVKQYKIVKYTIWLILAIQMIIFGC